MDSRQRQIALIKFLGTSRSADANLRLAHGSDSWTPDDWLGLAESSERQAVFSWFVHRAMNTERGCPADVRSSLAPRVKQANALAKLSAHLSLDLVSQFASRSIPMRVFKGQFLAQAAYGDALLRNSCDVDIIVPRTAVIAATRCLKDHGFSCGVAADWFADESFLTRFREVPFSSMGGLLSVDFHWRLASRWTPLAVTDDEMFDERLAVELNILGKPVPWFSTSLLWRIQLTHLVSSDWRGLKTWLDLAHTFDLLDEVNVADIVKRCMEQKCGDVLVIAAFVLRDVFGRDTSGLTARQSSDTLTRAGYAAKLCADVLSDSAYNPPDGITQSRLWYSAAATPKLKLLFARATQHDLEDYSSAQSGRPGGAFALKAVQRRLRRVSGL